jgi:hypothetical protein
MLFVLYLLIYNENYLLHPRYYIYSNNPFEGTSIGFINIILLGSYGSVPKLSTVVPAKIQSPFNFIIIACHGYVFFRNFGNLGTCSEIYEILGSLPKFSEDLGRI